jgi:hypothetical protein
VFPDLETDEYKDPAIDEGFNGDSTAWLARAG